MSGSFNGWSIIDLPTTPTAPKSVEWQAEDIVAGAVSPFSGQQQINNWQAGWLEASVRYAPMSNSDARAWVAFLLGLKGIANVFLFADPAGRQPQNLSASGGTVTGSGQTGYTLLTSSSGLLPGDLFSLGVRLYRVTSVTGGLLGIWPQIRESPAGGTDVVITNAKGLFRLKANRRGWSVDEAKHHGITFEIKEAL